MKNKMELNIICEVTEYESKPKKENTLVDFKIRERCVIISFMDENHKVLSQSEISLDDFVIISRITHQRSLPTFIG